MNDADIERMLRGQLDQMDAAERALRSDGHEKLADRCARQNAKVRRRVERALAEMPARRAAVDARWADGLRDLIDGLERGLAAGGAHE